MMDVRRTEGAGHDRLTVLADEMSHVLIDKGPEAEDVKAVIMLQDGERGGICLHGYNDDTDALVDLFIHLKAIFEAQGKTLILAGLGGEVGRG